MSDATIPAEQRTEFGKGAARRLRRASKVPAVLYGHGTDPVHLSLPGHATMMALKQQNALLTLGIGDGTELALAKHVQRDPLRGDIEHVDLILVRRGERVTVDVTVHVVGDAAPDTLINVVLAELSVEAEATHLPEYVEVSVEGLAAGTQVHVKDLDLPRGVTTALDEEDIVVVVQAAPTAEELEAELDEDAAADTTEDAEGEDDAAEGDDAESTES